jgi:urea ABC transporter permease protein UrtC
MSRFMAFAILALSLDLLWGYTGLLSFGHGAFFGIGAYALGLVLKYFNFTGATYVGLLLGVLGPMIIAAIFGYFLFYGRVSGIYFGIIMLAFTTICGTIAINTFHLTGGYNGLYGTFLRPTFGIPGLWEYQRTLTNNYANYYTAMVGLIAAFVFSFYLANKPIGKVLLAIKNNEDRMEYLGYNVPKCKTWIFVIACGMAGFAGCMSVPIRFLAPSTFSLAFSIQIIIWLAVGGRGTLIGAVIGTLVVSYMREFLSAGFENYWLLLMGIFFVLVVVFEPDGIIGMYRRIISKKSNSVSQANVKQKEKVQNYG